MLERVELVLRDIMCFWGLCFVPFLSFFPPRVEGKLVQRPLTLRRPFLTLAFVSFVFINRLNCRFLWELTTENVGWRQTLSWRHVSQLRPLTLKLVQRTPPAPISHSVSSQEVLNPSQGTANLSPVCRSPLKLAVAGRSLPTTRHLVEFSSHSIGEHSLKLKSFGCFFFFFSIFLAPSASTCLRLSLLFSDEWRKRACLMNALTERRAHDKTLLPFCMSMCELFVKDDVGKKQKQTKKADDEVYFAFF